MGCWGRSMGLREGKLQQAVINYVVWSFMILFLTQYCCGDIIKEDGLDGACSTCRREEKFLQHVAGKPEGKIPFGKDRHRWKGTMKMDHKETGWGGMDWIYVAQKRDMWCVLVNMVMKLQVAWNVVSAWNSWGSPSVSRMTVLYGSTYIILHWISFEKKTSFNQEMIVFQLLSISWQNIHVVVGQRLILCDMGCCITVLL